jgi:hypothetical protein
MRLERRFDYRLEIRECRLMIVDFGFLNWKNMTPHQLEDWRIDFAVSP